MYSREKIIQTLRDIVEEASTIDPYVIVAQPRRDATETPAQKFNAYGECHADFMGYSLGFVDISGEKVDVARNYLIDRVLETKAKYLFFIGDDTVVPYDAFKKLHATAEANPNSMVAGVYYVKCGGPMIDVLEGTLCREANVDPGQLLDLWQGGLDCILIPTSILHHLNKQDPDLPFCCVANNIDDFPFIGEDNFFYHRVRKAGFKILCDTNVQCLHMDLDTGKYTAHPDVDLANYYTLIEPTTRLTIADKRYIDQRWTTRLPIGTGNNSWIPGYSIPELIKNIENPVGVEIGTAEGFTTEFLLRGTPTLKLTGIDPYLPYRDWDQNMLTESRQDNEKKMFLHKVTPYAEQGRYMHYFDTSDDALGNFADESLDFVFIDGLHTFAQVLKDCVNYYQKLKPGGLICGHDYTRIADVKSAVDDFAASIGKEIKQADQDIWYFYKDRPVQVF